MEIKLDGETADRITALTLAQHCEWLEQQLAGDKLHDEDRGRYHRLTQAMNMLVNEYFQVP